MAISVITNRPYKFTCIGGSLPNAMTYEFTGTTNIESLTIKDSVDNTITTLKFRSVTMDFSVDIARVASGLFEPTDLDFTPFLSKQLLTDTKVVRQVYIESDSSNKIFAVRAQIQNENGDFGEYVIREDSFALVDFADDEFAFGDFG